MTFADLNLTLTHLSRAVDGDDDASADADVICRNETDKFDLKNKENSSFFLVIHMLAGDDDEAKA
jgi:hypothetical protein